MPTQGGFGVLGAEQTALLQDRHHPVDKLLEPRRQHCGHDVEAVGRAAVEPVLDRVGHLLGRARESAVASTAAEAFDELPHREVLPSRELHDERVPALGSLDLVLGRQVLRQRLVERKLLRPQPEPFGELAAGVLGRDQPGQFGVEFTRFLLRIADDGHDARRISTCRGSRPTLPTRSLTSS